MTPDELKHEIANAEQAVENALIELGHCRGGLSVMRQLLAKVEADMAKATAEDTTKAE